MPLDKQVVGVTFTQGLDTQTDKRVVLPGRMVSLQNVTMAAADTFRRRNGNAALVGGTAIGGLSTRGDELLALDGTSLKSYSSASGALYTEGTVDNLALSKSEIARGTGGQDSYDCATSGGYTCYVWRDFTAAGTVSGVKVTIHDESTGTNVLAETFLKSSATAFCPRVVAVTGAFIIFYGDAPAPPATLYARVVDLTAPSTLGAETSLRTDFSTNIGKFDAIASGASAFLYYVTDDATTSTRALAVTRSGTTPSVSAGPLNVTSQAQIASTVIGGLTLAFYSASLIGVFVVTQTGAGTPGMWAGVITTAMASSVASAVKDATAAVLSVANVTAVLNGSTMYVYSDDYGRTGEATATARLIRRTGLSSANAITVAAATWAFSMTRPNGTNGPFIVGKAFLVGTTAYLPVAISEAGTGTLQNLWLLLNDSARVVARALFGTYGVPTTTVFGIPTPLALSSTKYAIPAGERTILALASSGTTATSVVNVSPTGMARLTVEFFTTQPLIDGNLGPITFFANGVISAFDGDAATESAFVTFPEVVTAAAGAGGNVPNGDHGLVALYEWIDGQGQRHQSAPSVPITLTVAAGPKTCTVTVPALPLTQKANVTVVAFATTAGGTIYYRVNPVSSPVANSLTAPTVTITYNLTDASLQTGELLYTTGGALPNDGPPPCSALAVHQNRVFVNPSDDPFTTQFSQPWVAGFGVQWNETLRFRVESTGGTVAGYASIDDKLIIFRPRKIGVLFGQGPTTAGLQNGYQLQDLPTDVGCSEPRSILVMPEGVIFKSTSKGWYLLGRDLQLRWIGAGVQGQDSQGVTSAVLLDTIKECRFTTNDASGLTLVYNYQQRGPDGIGQWSTFSNFTGVDAVWWPGGNAYVRATATSILKELPANASGYAYGDGAISTMGTTPTTSPAAQTGSTIPLVFQTGWLKPGEALQAFQRVWRVLLTGAAAGSPPFGYTTVTANVLAGATALTVGSTSGFEEDDNALVSFGSSRYEVGTDYIVTDATTLTFGSPLANDHNIGDIIRTDRSQTGAAGTLQVDFYFDGNDSTAFQTITISDVSDLVNGNAWDVRLQPNLQKCDSIMMKVTSTPHAKDPGASLNFSGMTMELGVKKGAKKYSAAKTK